MGCYKDHDDRKEKSYTEDTITLVETSVIGKVRDTSGSLMNEYTLVINNDTKEINASYFNISVNDVKKKGQIIKAKKDGKTIGVYSGVLIENDINKIEIQTIDVSETITPNGSFSISLSDDIEVSSNSNNEIHLGYTKVASDVPVFGKYGQLQVSNDAEIVVLEHLISSDTDSYTINHTNDQKILFTEENGRWVQLERPNNGGVFEGLQDGCYLLASVEDAVLIEGSVRYDQNTVSYMNYEGISQKSQVSAFSTSNGKYGMILPSNTSAQLIGKDMCNADISKQNITTSGSSNINITLSGDEIPAYSIKTEVLDCDGDIDNSPILRVDKSGESEVFAFDQPTIDTWIIGCPKNIEISAVQKGTDENGLKLHWEQENNQDINYISTCDSHKMGFSYISIDEDKKIYPPFTYNVESGKTTFTSIDEDVVIKITGEFPMMGSSEDINLYINDVNLGGGYYVSCLNSSEGCGVEEYSLTRYNEGEKYIHVTFKGKVWMKRISPLKAGYFDIQGCVFIRQQ